jgi:hypothetical protein
VSERRVLKRKQGPRQREKGCLLISTSTYMEPRTGFKIRCRNLLVKCGGGDAAINPYPNPYGVQQVRDFNLMSC